MARLLRGFFKPVLLTVTVCVAVEAADLYRVEVSSHQDASALRQASVDVLLRLCNGYLVLVESEGAARLTGTGLRCDLVAADIDRQHLAIDIRQDGSGSGRYPVVYEERGLRIVRVHPDDLYQSAEPSGLAPILTSELRIADQAESGYQRGLSRIILDLDSLVSMVLQDSIESNAYRLEAFNGRVTGTDSNDAARDWLAGKFAGFGYDSIVIDPFVAVINGSPTECHNVVAYKPGTTFPDHQIVIGAHRDAVIGSPGADDNGSGADAVLELARVLRDVETRMTFVFILFDAEEWGLYGSWHYADAAASRGDSIVLMINMDMIGHYENADEAVVIYGQDSTYANLWRNLADSLSGIALTATIIEASGSDDLPFRQNGYPAIMAHEYIFSSVYHSPQDSTTYLNFDYLTRMTRGVLATAYVVDQTRTVSLLLLTLPEGVPSMILPGLASDLILQVAEYGGGVLVPGSVQLHYSVDSEPEIVLGMDAIGDDVYRATLPPMSCFSHVRFYFSASEVSAGTLHFPDPSGPLRAIVGTREATIFEDDFNDDLGWSVMGDARMGAWERVIPPWHSAIWGAPYSDFDRSGYCYLTGSDHVVNVDDGTTILVSPAISTRSNDAVVRYARWYANYYPLGTPYNDTFKVFVRRSGMSWALAEKVGPIEQCHGGWYTHQFWVSDFFDPGESLYVRFDASDLDDPSHVEAAVDAVEIIRYTCEPLIVTDTLPGWTAGIGYSQQLLAVGCCSTFVWTDKDGGLAGSGLTLSSGGLVSGESSGPATISFIAVASDDSAATDEKPFSFEINPTPEIVTDSLPVGRAGESYSFPLAASGGTGALIWVDRNDDLSGTGLCLTTQGLLLGIPADTGMFGFTASVEDVVGAADERPLTLRVGLAYICGNVDGVVGPGGGVDVADLTYLVGYLFSLGPPPPVMEAANVDGITGPGGPVDVADVTYLVAYLFGGGPGPVCG